MLWTDIADKCPVTRQWLTDTFDINVNTGRIRFMLLEAGGYIIPHTDRENKYLQEVNIAIKNPNQNIFRFLNYGTVPFNDGDAYMLDVSNKHLVYNASTEDRLHIIAHAKVSDKLIEDSYGNCHYS